MLGKTNAFRGYTKNFDGTAKSGLQFSIPQTNTTLIAISSALG